MKSPVPPYLHAGDIYGAMLLHWADEFATLAERYRAALVRATPLTFGVER